MAFLYFIIYLLFCSYLNSQTLENCDEVSCVCVPNENQEVVCIKCRIGFRMNKSKNTCQIIYSQQQNSQELISSNEAKIDGIWIKCSERYTLITGQCLFFCQENKQYLLDHTNCLNIQIKDNCINYKGISGNLCIQCGNNTYLQGQECVSNCEQNTSPNENGICLCKDNLYNHNNNCLKECPPYYSPNNYLKTCERWCIPNHFPLISVWDNSITCVKVDSSQDQFCSNHLLYLPKLIHARQIVKKEDETILILELIQTPIVCYEILLKGKGDFYLNRIFTQQFPDKIQFIYAIDNDDLQKIQCDDTYYHLNIVVKYLTVAQYSFKIKINIT